MSAATRQPGLDPPGRAAEGRADAVCWTMDQAIIGADFYIADSLYQVTGGYSCLLLSSDISCIFGIASASVSITTMNIFVECKSMRRGEEFWVVMVRSNCWLLCSLDTDGAAADTALPITIL